jgi:hypothetical protein
MQENAAPPRVGRDALVAHERSALARMSHVYSKAMSSVLEVIASPSIGTASGADLTFAHTLPRSPYANVKSKAPLAAIIASGPLT